MSLSPPALSLTDQVNGNDELPTRDSQRRTTKGIQDLKSEFHTQGTTSLLTRGMGHGNDATKHGPAKKRAKRRLQLTTPSTPKQCCGKPSTFEMETCIPDSDDELFDPSLGWSDPANIKRPMKGFSKEYQDTLIPYIEHASAHLLEIVDEMQEKIYDQALRVLRNSKEPLLIPRSLYAVEGGADLYISAGPFTPERLTLGKRTAGPDLTIKPTKRIGLSPDSSKEPTPEMVELSPGEKALATVVIPEGAELTKDTLDALMKPFELGWKRELVWRSGASLKKTGDIFYYPPEGKKLRSSKQLALYLEEYPESGLLVSNFSFSKRPIGIENENYEMIRTANAGLVVKKKPVTQRKVPEKREVKPKANFSPDIIHGAKSSPPTRRSIQKPKRYATDEFALSEKKPKSSPRNQNKTEDRDNENSVMEMGMLPPMYPRGREDGNPVNTLTENGWSPPEGRKRGRPPKILAKPHHFASGLEEGDSAMFQISAFRKAQDLGMFSRMNEEYGNNEDGGNYNDDGMMGLYDERSFDHDQAMGSSNKEELLPCSIRCDNTGGEVPSLQCKLCLCLYHPQCLGIDPNLDFNNDFLCANCEGGQSKRSTRNPPQQTMALPKFKKDLGKSSMMAEMTKKFETKSLKPIPPLTPLGKFPKLPVPPLVGKFDQPRFRVFKGKKIQMPSFMCDNDLRDSNRESMSISPISIPKRGRGRPPGPRRPFPPALSHSNLTITPISIPKKPAVPFLQQMGKMPALGPFPKLGKGISLSDLQIPRLGQTKSQFQQLKAKIDKQFALSSESLRVQKEVEKSEVRKSVSLTTLATPAATQQPAAPPPLTKQHKSHHVYKRFPQSVVAIGPKKFVCVPRMSHRSETIVRAETNAEEELDVKNDGPSTRPTKLDEVAMVPSSTTMEMLSKEEENEAPVEAENIESSNMGNEMNDEDSASPVKKDWTAMISSSSTINMFNNEEENEAPPIKPDEVAMKYLPSTLEIFNNDENEAPPTKPDEVAMDTTMEMFNKEEENEVPPMNPEEDPMVFSSTTMEIFNKEENEDPPTKPDEVAIVSHSTTMEMFKNDEMNEAPPTEPDEAAQVAMNSPTTMEMINNEENEAPPTKLDEIKAVFSSTTMEIFSNEEENEDTPIEPDQVAMNSSSTTMEMLNNAEENESSPTKPDEIEMAFSSTTMEMLSNEDENEELSIKPDQVATDSSSSTMDMFNNEEESVAPPTKPDEVAMVFSSTTMDMLSNEEEKEVPSRKPDEVAVVSSSTTMEIFNNEEENEAPIEAEI